MTKSKMLFGPYPKEFVSIEEALANTGINFASENKTETDNFPVTYTFILILASEPSRDAFSTKAPRSKSVAFVDETEEQQPPATPNPRRSSRIQKRESKPRRSSRILERESLRTVATTPSRKRARSSSRTRTRSSSKSKSKKTRRSRSLSPRRT
jgi:hypothetical protein